MLFFEHGADILEYKTPENIFLVEPYIPMQSVALLYGMPTLGKTPIGWAMAEAIQTGGKFWGVQAQQGNALLVELDMPLYLVKDRWLKAQPMFAPSFGALFDPLGIDSPQLLSPYADRRHKAFLEVLLKFQQDYAPKFVMVDSLRKVIRGDINAPGIADAVYGAWKTIFPDAAVMFIHHESKDSIHGTDPLQKAKGSMEFVDIAQVGMRLAKTPKGVYLSVTKTQASAIPPPRLVQLKGDGIHFV